MAHSRKRRFVSLWDLGKTLFSTCWTNFRYVFVFIVFPNKFQRYFVITYGRIDFKKFFKKKCSFLTKFQMIKIASVPQTQSRNQRVKKRWKRGLISLLNFVYTFFRYSKNMAYHLSILSTRNSIQISTKHFSSRRYKESNRVQL